MASQDSQHSDTSSTDEQAAPSDRGPVGPHGSDAGPDTGSDPGAAPAPKTRKRASRRASAPAAAAPARPAGEIAAASQPPADTPQAAVTPEATDTPQAADAIAPAPAVKAPRKRASRAKAAAPQQAPAAASPQVEAPQADTPQAQSPQPDITPAETPQTGGATSPVDPAGPVAALEVLAEVDLDADPDPTDDETSEPAAPFAPVAPSAPVGPPATFGLLFQAPDIASLPVRDEARPARPEPDEPDDDGAEQDDSAEQDDTTGRGDRDDRDGDRDDDDSPRRSRRRGRGRGRSAGSDPARAERPDRDDDAATGDDTTDGSGADDADRGDGSEDSSDDSGDGGRRRRRRGGRGRRREDGDTGDESGDARPGGSDDADDEGGSQDDRGDENGADGDDGDDGGPSNGRKRTRRRRRSGASGGTDDPPGTVTKVREPRQERDEATGIKGSTRLEAKRQRRREGREAGRRRTIITEAEFLARRESVQRVMVVREQGAMTQIGVLEDGVLVEHYISGPGSTSHVAGSSMAGNVYLGRVQNVLPSMEAAFVDIGKGRNAVLYAGEVNWDAAGLEQHKARRIENALKGGQSVLVQVTKDPIGHKGARLTSQVSLPGRYLVYVPDGSMTGISRKLPEPERARLKKILKEVVPADAGVIVRTAAEGASEKELRSDVERLQKDWERIQKKAAKGGAPALLHGEPDLTVRVVRDVFNEDFTSLVVAGDGAWDQVSDYVDSVAPDLAPRVSRWTGERDVFSHYRIDEQLAKAMDRKVWLPSGGSLVIDRTEAMTVVDVNTGKFTGAGGNLEETVTKNNIEAAEEIVRQLRLRDVGGIIVIDFIDMVLESNRDLVVRRLLECLGRDRTKHQVAEVTSLGLVQMTRKRVGAGLIEVFSEPCEHCSGRGLVVHDDPVDRSTADSAADSGRGGRGRKGRGKDTGRDGGRAEAPPAPAPSGPTPAQIAAAAYAAALQSHADDDAGEPADLDVETASARVTQALEASLAEASDVAAAGETRPSSSTAASSTAASSPAPASAPEASAEPATRPTGRVRRRAGSATTAPPSAASPSATSTDVPEPAVDSPAPPVPPTEPPVAPETEPAAAPPARRRGSRRAGTSGATTTADPGAGVFTVAPAPGGNSDVAAALGATGTASSSSSSPSPATTEATEPTAPASPAPARRKRARVVAPAGPPTGLGDDDGA
ncbi:Rne/Rng family ribonuclease [Agilicoccus flavus]|uniref:Rne/Rng family ribonuclease n=1 Tax=Agilicoccus flavus TaxID=2775968 RepID=UPI001CF6B4EB|nr:Rne/Rng family ribonuclease [Agilicoccus flavus]